MELFRFARAAAIVATATMMPAPPGGVIGAATPAPVSTKSPVAGTWRAVLTSPGGELPFGLVIEEKPAGGFGASVTNGPETIPFTSVKVSGSTVTLRFDHYDSEIVAEIAASGNEMRGSWTKQAGKDRPSMPFAATRSDGAKPLRFGPRAGTTGDGGTRHGAAGAGSVRDVSGAWDVVFTDEDGDSAARAEFEQDGERLLGTFLTPTGDFRYLEGDFGGGLLRLSCFDGGHAFLFVARASADGTLAGDFWSRGSSHATWRARRSERADSAMPDPFGMTSLKNPSGRLRFTFPDLDGRPVSLADARFKGKVVLVEIFGSWCPNCNDQAPVLAELYRTYHGRGLEIIGLAYEMTGDASRDAVFVRKYAERHHAAWPLLLAGTSDKAEASASLPDLSGVLAFPTLIFVGRDGAVKSIHTGFAGPGTGAHFTDLKARYVTLIEGLLGG